MKPVFLDTVGLLALWDANDQWHAAALSAFSAFTSKQRTVITSGYVLLECANAAARRTYRNDLLQLRNELVAVGVVVEPTAADRATAWAEYQRGGSTGPGVVDLVSFAIMRRMGITQAFTNDRHFRAAGFITLF